MQRCRTISGQPGLWGFSPSAPPSICWRQARSIHRDQQATLFEMTEPGRPHSIAISKNFSNSLAFMLVISASHLQCRAIGFSRYRVLVGYFAPGISSRKMTTRLSNERWAIAKRYSAWNSGAVPNSYMKLNRANHLSCEAVRPCPSRSGLCNVMSRYRLTLQVDRIIAVTLSR